MVGAVMAIYILDDHNLTTLHAAGRNRGNTIRLPRQPRRPPPSGLWPGFPQVWSNPAVEGIERSKSGPSRVWRRFRDHRDQPPVAEEK